MVKTPKVFLMDEPLSNLDAKLRNQMRSELIQLHKRLKSTFVYVTHDQVEAMSMADKIVIMDKGKIMQVDSPKEIYKNPKNIFVAQFIGNPAMNIIKMEEHDISYGFRPEKVKLEKERNFKGIVLKGQVITKEILGSEVIYCVKIDSNDVMLRTSNDELKVDEFINLYINIEDLYYFDKDGSRIYEEIKIIELLEIIECGGKIDEKAI